MSSTHEASDEVVVVVVVAVLVVVVVVSPDDDVEVESVVIAESACPHGPVHTSL